MDFFPAFTSSVKAYICNIFNMFRAIGLVIVLWYVSHLFGQSFVELDRASTAVLRLAEHAAVAADQKIQ